MTAMKIFYTKYVPEEMVSEQMPHVIFLPSARSE